MEAAMKKFDWESVKLFLKHPKISVNAKNQVTAIITIYCSSLEDRCKTITLVDRTERQR